MVGSNPYVQIPVDLTKLFEVKDTSEPLRKFLTDLMNRVNILEETVKAQDVRIKALE